MTPVPSTRPTGRRTLALALSAVFLAAACAGTHPAAAPAVPSPAAETRQPLNSERIAARFGSYGVEVLEADATTRVANLFSGSGDRRVCRTFAVTRFPDAVDPRVAAEHAEIVAGGSIGAVFERHGWRVAKRQLLIAEIPWPAPGDRLATLMALPPANAGARLAIHVYGFSVARDGATVEYATIAEVYHPDYLDVAAARAIWGPAPAAPGGDAALAALLELVARASRAPLALAPGSAERSAA